MNYPQFEAKFPDEKAAIDYFVKIRYGGVLTCPHCGKTTKVYRYREVKKLCHCKNCNNSFSPLKNTIFEKSTTPLRKWFFVMHLFLNNRKGCSACFIQRECVVTYKTAWRMLQQIRLAMEGEGIELFESTVEVDEMYVGGKPKRYPPKKGVDLSLLDSSEGYVMAEPQEEPSEPSKLRYGRGTRKTPVVGIKERKSGKVYARPMLPDKVGKKLSGKQLYSLIEEKCKEGITVMTDDFSGYKALDKDDPLKLLEGLPPSPRFDHKTVCHSSGEYVAPGGVHTNGIESHWALFKRGFHGTYHSISDKYLPRYLDEFSFRQNTRRMPPIDVFDLLLKRSVKPPKP